MTIYGRNFHAKTQRRKGEKCLRVFAPLREKFFTTFGAMAPLKVYQFTMDLDTYLDLEVPTIVFWKQTAQLFPENGGYTRELYEPNELDMDKPFSIYLETNHPAFAAEFAELTRLTPEEVTNFDIRKLKKKFPASGIV